MPPSWKLTNGPWMFVESDPGTCRQGAWTRLDIREHAISQDAPLWYCANGFVPQAEGSSEAAAAFNWVYTQMRPWTASIAPVTTLGIDVAPWRSLAISSCFVECYLQGQPNALDKYGEAFREGWEDAIPVVGVGFTGENGTYSLADYEQWLRQFGKRFAVYATDPMGDEDWQTLTRLVS